MLIRLHLQYEKHRAEEHERIKEVQEQHPADLFYMRQFTHNACGTVALIHSVANNKEWVFFLFFIIFKKKMYFISNLSLQSRYRQWCFEELPGEDSLAIPGGTWPGFGDRHGLHRRSSGFGPGGPDQCQRARDGDPSLYSPGKH